MNTTYKHRFDQMCNFRLLMYDLFTWTTNRI